MHHRNVNRIGRALEIVGAVGLATLVSLDRKHDKKRVYFCGKVFKLLSLENKMEKRGQVAVFIIIAVVIIALIGLFFMFRGKGNLNEETPTFPPTVSPIYTFIKDCIKETATYGTYVIAAKGGYYFSPEASADSGEPYYVLAKKSLIPDRKKVQSQLGAYVQVNLRECLDDFKEFPDFNISSDDITVNANWKPNRFLVDVHYPITVRKGNFTFDFSDFNRTEIITNAYLLYSVASNYSNIYLNTGGLSLTYASNLEDDSNITSNFQHYPNYTLVTLTYNATYQWRFALA